MFCVSQNSRWGGTWESRVPGGEALTPLPLSRYSAIPFNALRGAPCILTSWHGRDEIHYHFSAPSNDGSVAPTVGFPSCRQGEAAMAYVKLRFSSCWI